MKKGKLILSLSLMCLSIAVLCFGVFAAASVSYSISGTISYTVNDAFVIVSTNVYSGANQYTTDDSLSTLATKLANGEEGITNSGFTLDENYKIDDYDSTDDTTTNTKTLNLTLSSTIKSYLIKMEIQNLSPSVKVWVNANWTLSDDTNISQGNNSSQSNIEKGSPKCIYYIVSIKDMTQSVSEISYTMKLDIGIGERPIEATSDGNTITATEGMTWATFVTNNSGYSTTVENSVTYVIKDDEILKKDGVKVQVTDTIEEGANYLTKLYILKNSNTYWYVELGRLSDGTAIQWELVSLDGSTRYEYSSNKPKTDTGSIFVQKTYVTTSYFGAAWAGGTSDRFYEGSYMQRYLKGLETFGTDNDYGIENEPSYIGSYTCDVGSPLAVNGDKFWLLSKTQAEKFFTDDSARKFSNGTSYVYWWLRTFDTDYDENEGYAVGDNGYIGWCKNSDSYAVRAAFQLA